MNAPEEHLNHRIAALGAALMNLANPASVSKSQGAVPATLQWTRADSAAAIAEGWDVFDNSERGQEIERVDDPNDGWSNSVPPPFADDGAAIGHVYFRAQDGSRLHQKALLITLGAMKGFGQNFEAAPEAPAPSEVPAAVDDAELQRLRTLCERLGIALTQAQEPEVQGRWDWRDEHGNASEVSLESEQAAALAALEAKYADSWRWDTHNGHTRRGFVEHVESEVDDMEVARGWRL